MLTHFAFTSRCLRQFRLSHENLADFPVCIVITRPRRLTPNSAVTNSQSDTFSTISRWNSDIPANHGLVESEVQKCSLPEEHRDDESKDPSWAQRSLPQTRQYVFDLVNPRRRTKKHYTEYLRPVNAKLVVPRSNTIRTPHTSPKNTSSLEVETTGPLLYDKKGVESVRFRQLAPRSGTQMRKTSGPEVVLKDITPLPSTKVTSEAHFEEAQDPVRLRKHVVEASPVQLVASNRADTLGSSCTRNSTVAVYSNVVQKNLPPSGSFREMTGSGIRQRSAVRPSVSHRSVFSAPNLPDIVAPSTRSKKVSSAPNSPHTVEIPGRLGKHILSLPIIKVRIDPHIVKTQDPVPIKEPPAVASPTQDRRGRNRSETSKSSSTRKLTIDASSAVIKKGNTTTPPRLFKSVSKGPSPPIVTESSDLVERPILHGKSSPPKICRTATDGHVRIVKSKVPLATETLSSEPEIPREPSLGKTKSVVHQIRGPKREASLFKKIHLRAYQFPNVDRPKASLDKFSRTWSMRYAVIAERKWSLEVPRKGATQLWQSLVSLNMDSKGILQAWSKFPAEQLDEVWCNFMLWAMQHSPERALKVLDVAISDGIPNIPRYILGNCLDYLAAFYLEGLKSVDSVKVDSIVNLTCKFVSNSGFKEGGHPSFLEQRILYLVLTCCRNDQAQYFWDLLARHGIELTCWTLFQFLGKFAKMGDLSRSMEALRRGLQTSISPTSPDVQYGCVTLLRARFDGKHWYAAQTYIWTQLLQMDIPPSIHIYNALIHNCLDADDYETALTMYAKARENNLTPDTFTYHSLLKGVRRGWDFNVLDLIVCDAEADGTLPESDFLICDILAAAIPLDFPKLLRLYGRYYDPAPLSDFGLIEPGQSFVDSNPKSRQPSSLAVGIMLTAYIKQNLTSDAVIGLYERYCTLGREFHPLVMEMASSDYVSNAFIQAFGQRYETLELCTVVVRAMLHPTPSPVYRFEPMPGAEVAPPTIITWSLLLQAFCRHGQMLAAEKVMTMMRDRGVEPNHLTWSILIYGHAAAQDIDSALDAVKRMEDESFPVNNYIVTALGMFGDRNRLLQAVDEAAKGDLGAQTALPDAERKDMPAEEKISEPKQETETRLDPPSTISHT